MDKYIKSIIKMVKKETKLRNINNKDEEKEYIESCYDEFLLFKEKGLSDLLTLKETEKSFVKSLNLISLPYNKNTNNLSFIFSIIYFLVSLIITLIGTIILNIKEIYRIIYPLLSLIIIGLIIYSLINHKKINFFDYLIIAIIFISILQINIQIIIYFFKARTGDYYYTARYLFPDIIQFNRYWITSFNPEIYEIDYTKILFDPCFLSSFICLIASIIHKFYKKRNLKINLDYTLLYFLIY